MKFLNRMEIDQTLDRARRLGPRVHLLAARFLKAPSDGVAPPPRAASFYRCAKVGRSPPMSRRLFRGPLGVVSRPSRATALKPAYKAKSATSSIGTAHAPLRSDRSPAIQKEHAKRTFCRGRSGILLECADDRRLVGQVDLQRMGAGAAHPGQRSPLSGPRPPLPSRPRVDARTAR